MKDNFSENAAGYKKFRPVYPKELYDHIMPLIEDKQAAWDCGTGNGQVAIELAKRFKEVQATDISRAQISNAATAGNIFYSVQPAEHTNFQSSSFNLVTVAQAIHWFSFDEFYAEVKRVLRPGGLLAVIGYGLIAAEAPISKIIHHFYFDLIGPYWDKERRYIDEGYRTIPFPFKEVQAPGLYNQFHWSMEQLLGYIETWSAVQHYKKARQHDPLVFLKEELQKHWPADVKKEFTFPILLRLGKM